MAKKNGFLSRKEKRQYSREIQSKLEALGMQNETTFIPYKTRNGQPAVRTYVDGTGKEVFKGEVGKLSNPYKNLVRRLRKMPKKVVQNFLGAQLPGSEKK